MHLDIRSNSRGTCPKCLMDLVAEGRDAKRARHWAGALPRPTSTFPTTGNS